jgi:UPF0716 protein FxsA
MALLLVVLFVVAPLVELAVIVQVSGALGVLNTLGLLIAVSILGAWLAKREGLSVLRRIQSALDQGRLPSREVVDGGLILLAGSLMIAPGFISDCLALLLLIPPTRALARGPLLRFVTRRGRVAMASWGGPGTRGAGVWDVESWEDPPPSSTRGELGGRT